MTKHLDIAGGDSVLSTDCPCNNGCSVVVPDLLAMITTVNQVWKLPESCMLRTVYGMDSNIMESSLPVVYTTPNMPWFLKALNGKTNNDIELRVCCTLSPTSEEIPLDILLRYILSN